MDRPHYLYLLYETPIEWPYYCKVGYTDDPRRRLAQLQAGNPRPLRSRDYAGRPSGVFGFPLPSRKHASALEARVFERCREYGLTLYGDVDYERLRASRREWVSGLHPDDLEKIMREEWIAYRDTHGLDDAPAASPP
jgi:hypothetical protein